MDASRIVAFDFLRLLFLRLNLHFLQNKNENIFSWWERPWSIRLLFCIINFSIIVIHDDVTSFKTFPASTSDVFNLESSQLMHALCGINFHSSSHGDRCLGNAFEIFFSKKCSPNKFQVFVVSEQIWSPALEDGFVCEIFWIRKCLHACKGGGINLVDKLASSGHKVQRAELIGQGLVKRSEKFKRPRCSADVERNIGLINAMHLSGEIQQETSWALKELSWDAVSPNEAWKTLRMQFQESPLLRLSRPNFTLFFSPTF